jgi:hypothetical protein
MAYETKVILTLLAQQAALAESPREIYACIARAANAEGLTLPTYDELREEIRTEQAKG